MIIRSGIRTFIGIIIAVYVDDVFVLGPAEAIDSACNAIKSVCRILGFQLGHSMEQVPAAVLSLLGEDIAIDRVGITARSPGRGNQEP